MKEIKIEKVLIAIDYDPSAQKVAEVGLSLSRNGETEFTILHVITESNKYSLNKHITIMGFGGNNEVAPSKLESIDDIKNEVLLYLEKTKHHLGDKYIQTIVVEGDITESILRTAKDLHVDVIVLGFQKNNPRESSSDLSITENILHKTHIPLFVIPTNEANHY